MTPVVSGALVALVRPERAWFALAAGWINDPRVSRTLVTAVPWPVSEIEVEGWLPLAEPLTAFLIAPLGGERPVGLCHFHSYDVSARSIKLALLLEPAAQNRGYGGEAAGLMLDYAFGRFDLHRVALSAFSSTPGGLRAYERAGFRREGTRRRAWFRDGEWHDDVIMSVLRREWEAERRA